jgi:hypothetical protein
MHSAIDSKKLVKSYLQALRVVLPLTTANISKKRESDTSQHMLVYTYPSVLKLLHTNNLRQSERTER